MAEELYTLDQARRIIRGERCVKQGHQLTAVSADRVRCSRCEQDYQLVPIEDAAEQTRGE